jgi:hypothetical protein
MKLHNLRLRAYLILALLLAGCTGQNGQEPAPLLTPSPDVGALIVTLAPKGPDVEEPEPTQGVREAAAGDCEDSLIFIQDVTIPDGTVVVPESTMDKRWEVENSGNCNWDDRYRVRLIAGPEMGAQKEQALYPARSGTRATIRILFKAPVEPGTYRSAWQAFNPQGEPFGDPFFIEIVVETP